MKRKRKKSGLRGRLVSIGGSASGGASIAGAHQVCHSLCTGLIALLAVAGVSVSGMPLLFLQDYAAYFWSMGIFFLGLMVFLYLKGHYKSKTFIIFNSGLLVAGVPFAFLEGYTVIFWTAGAALVLMSILAFINSRL